VISPETLREVLALRFALFQARDHQTIQLSGQKDVKATHQNPKITCLLSYDRHIE
jgi:hypothetical protein